MKIRILLSLSVIAFVVFGLLFLNNISSPIFPVKNVEEITEVPTISQTTHTLQAGEKIGLPVRITIPAIDLNASIEKVALAADGTMDVPKYFLNTGWYELGPRPGELGSAVIAGHVDWINGATAVFANLYKLQAGDKIAVQDDKGAIISFVVRESRKYDAAADATDVFISNDGKAHLNIITCDGSWDKNINQYSKRLIVFTDKE
jgi:LPXTG-site transpeptidase (sortase) family protein